MAALVSSSEKHLIFFFVVLACIAVLVRESNAYPSPPPWLPPSSHVFTESAECQRDVELLDLCQRCAKLTKSRLAYPACCSNDILARRWCNDYVHFSNKS